MLKLLQYPTHGIRENLVHKATATSYGTDEYAHPQSETWNLVSVRIGEQQRATHILTKAYAACTQNV